MPKSEVGDTPSFGEEHGAGKYEKGIDALSGNPGESFAQLVGAFHGDELKLDIKGPCSFSCLLHHVGHGALTVCAGMPQDGDPRDGGKCFFKQAQTLWNQCRAEE